MRKAMRVVGRVLAIVSFLALLAVGCAWLRSYAVTDYIQATSEQNVVGRALSADEIWSSRGELALLRRREAFRDVPAGSPVKRHESADDVYWGISQPTEREPYDSDLVDCLRTRKWGFGFARVLEEEPWKRNGKFIGTLSAVTTTIAFPYWVLAGVLAILPSIWVGRRVRWNRSSARWRWRFSLTGMGRRALGMAQWASLVILLLLVFLAIRTQWVNWHISSYQQHEATIRGTKQFLWSTSASFEGWAVGFCRDGVMFMRLSPDAEPAHPWEVAQSRTVFFHYNGPLTLKRSSSWNPPVKSLRGLGFEFQRYHFVHDMGYATKRDLIQGEMGPPRPLPNVGVTQWSVAVPYWMLMGIATPLSVMRVYQWRKRRRTTRRALRGLCEGCGYDLRHSPGRCPECGRERLDALSKLSG